jgi:hypothetical protein
MFFSIKHETVVLLRASVKTMVETVRDSYHFVSHDKKIMFLGKSGNFLKFLSSKYFTHRVVRCVDDNDFGPRRDRAAINV